MPSWIALVWRSVLPEQTRSSPCSRARRGGRARRCRSPSCRPRSPRSSAARRRGVGGVVRAARRRAPLRRGHARRLRGRVQAARARCRRRPRRAPGSAPGGPRATRRRTSELEMSSRGMSKKRTRSGAPGSPASALGDVGPARRPRARRRRARASSSTASGSRQVGSEWAMSPPTMKVSSSSGASSCSARSGIDGVRRAGALGLDARDAEPLVAGHGALAQRHAVLDARVRLDRLVRRRAGPAPAARGRARAGRAPPGRRRDAPMCGGLNVPPSRPTRAGALRPGPGPCPRPGT